MKIIEKVAEEIRITNGKYGPFNSCHEVYGVLKEEVDEFWDFVKVNKNDLTDIEKIEYEKAMSHELIQIAAVALRAAEELRHDKIKWV